MKKLFLSISLVSALYCVNGADLIVEQDEIKQVSGQSLIYNNVIVKGILQVTDGSTIKLSKLSIGDSSNRYAEVVCDNSTISFPIGGVSSMTIGENNTLGKLKITNNGNVSMTSVEVTQDAAFDVTDQRINIMEIGSGSSFTANIISNLNDKSVAILFKGGKYNIADILNSFLIWRRNTTTTLYAVGVDRNPVNINSFNANSQIQSLTTLGDCDVYINSTTNSRLYNANYSFRNNGWVIFNNGWHKSNPYYTLSFFNDDVTGFKLINNAICDVFSSIYPKSRCLRFHNLDVTNGVLIANSQNTVEFSTSKSDGIYRGNVGAIIEKFGNYSMNIDAPSSCYSLNVKSGSINVQSPFVISNSLELSSSSDIKISAPLTYKSITYNHSPIELNDNGTFTYITSSNDYLLAINKTGGTLFKKGSHCLTIYDPISFKGDLCIEEGSVDFSSYKGRSEKYWRLTVTKINGSVAAPCIIGNIPFFAYESRQGQYYTTQTSYLTNGLYLVNSNLLDGGMGKTADQLAENYCAFESQVTYKSSAHMIGCNKYFLPYINNNFPNLETPVIDGSNTSITIVQHLKHDSAPVFGYDFVHSYSAERPASWILEASTNGTDWVVADTRENQKANSPSMSYCGFRCYSQFYTSCAFSFPILSYKESGVTNMPELIGLQVNSNCTADFRNVINRQGINNFIIDVTNNIGTIYSARFANSGTITLRNLSDDIQLSNKVFEPQLISCSGFENLNDWIVVVNGKPGKYLPFVKDGKLTFVPSGLIIRYGY